MKKIFTYALATGAILSTPAFASSLEERVEDLELSRDLNIFSFSGELENRFDYYTSRDKKNPTGSENASKNFWSTYFKFNMEAKPTDRLSFFGRMTFSKYWNDFAVRGGSGIASDSGAGGRDLAGTKMYIERAFINYKITNNLVYTIGRMPTVDGPPYHFGKGTARSGAYPMVSYASILDGMALTYGLGTGNGVLNIRGVFTPSTFKDSTADNTDNKSYNSDGVRIKETSPMYSLMLDYEGNATKIYNRLNVIGQYLRINEFALDRTVDKCSSTGAGSGTVTCAGTTSTISNLRFELDTFVLYAEMNGIAKTGLDFALTWKRTKTKSKGYLAGSGTGGSLGFLTGNADDTKSGNMFLVSTAYNFGSKYRVGYEYIDIDDGTFQLDSTENAIGFYGGAGSSGHHAFVMTKFDSTFKLILGYMTKQLDRSYVNGLLGAGSDVDKSRKAGYGRLIANF